MTTGVQYISSMDGLRDVRWVKRLKIFFKKKQKTIEQLMK